MTRCQSCFRQSRPEPGSDNRRRLDRSVVAKTIHLSPQITVPMRTYRIEWWYYTGNLEAEDGRRFGYQLTFFRTGLHKQPANPSRWAVRDLYTAHFAVSDIGNEQHHCFQRNNRQGIGQAGADSRTLRSLERRLEGLAGG